MLQKSITKSITIKSRRETPPSMKIPNTFVLLLFQKNYKRASRASTRFKDWILYETNDL